MSVLAHSCLSLEPSALAVRQIGPWLKKTLEEHRDESDPVVLRAELAVHEACLNVVDHANLPPGSTIDLCLDMTADELTIRIRDAGDEFDLAAVPSPDPEVLQVRGYGVKIIRALVSDLTYQRRGSLNELNLRIDLAAADE